jgi:hypothetical protein
MQVDCRDEVLTDGMHTYVRGICSGMHSIRFHC